MRIFKVKSFTRWARDQRISDAALKNATFEMQAGLSDANLGGGIHKKRIKIRGRGKSGGARTIVGFKSECHTFFLFGFLKRERDNIDQKELRALKQFAQALFQLHDEQIDKLLTQGELFEVE